MQSMEFQSKRRISSSSSSMILTGALSTLTPHQFTTLSRLLASASRLHRRRRLALLLSPALFSLTLRHLLSLSLPQKSLLIARFHLSTLTHLISSWDETMIGGGGVGGPGLLRLRDLDAALLLLLLCELRHHHPLALRGVSTTMWRALLLDYALGRMFTVSGLGLSTAAGVVSTYIHTTTRFLDVIGCGDRSIGKIGREVATAAATIVSLPSVNVSAGRVGIVLECVICKEEMREGREVCKLPCEHMFHWGCVLTWLKKRNTCPYCRFRLPTDDVLGEIERLWGILVNKSSTWNECQ